MAAFDRGAYSKCKFQLWNKHKKGLSVEKVNRKTRLWKGYDKILHNLISAEQDQVMLQKRFFFN